MTNMRFQNYKKNEITHSIHLKITTGINQVNVYLSLPIEHLNQRNITIKEIFPSPLEYLNIEGNDVAYFEFKSSTRISINCQLVTSEMKLEKSNSMAFLPKNVCKAFTRSQQLIQINDEIKNLARNIVKDEKEPLKQTELLFTWIVENIRYKKPSSNFGNLIALRNKRGDCGNMSFLFVSLCRALNIPARVIFGWWAIGPGKTGPHAWSECFIENYGWFPVDCAVSSLIKQAKRRYYLFSGTDFYDVSSDPKYYFGNIDNKRVIYSIGSELDVPHSYPDFMIEKYKKFNLDINGTPYIWGKLSQNQKILWLQPFFIDFKRENENIIRYPSFKSILTVKVPVRVRLIYYSHILSGILIFPSIIGLIFFHNPFFLLLTILFHATTALFLWKGTTRIFYIVILFLILISILLTLI